MADCNPDGEGLALNGMTRLKCPHCSQPFEIKTSAALPHEQRLSFVIKHEHPLLSVKTVHGTLAALEKMLKSAARDIGAECHVFLESVVCKPGETAFHLFISDSDVRRTVAKGNATRRQRD